MSANKNLAEKGVMMMMQNPPRLVVFRRSYVHPQTGVRVTLHPLPNIAQKGFFSEMLLGVSARPDVDKVLVEDGCLPYTSTHPRAAMIRQAHRFLPIIGFRPIADDTTKYDGVIARDPVESRIAYTSVLENEPLPTDPRARRAVERIMSYNNNTSVVVPWNTFHMPYFYEALPRLGFELEKNEEVLVVDRFNLLLFTLIPMIAFTWWILLFFKLVFGL